MPSMYTIKQELIDLLNEVEEAGGEITAEQEEKLVITEAELKSKLNDYHKAILNWEGDILACKEEEKRIAATRKKYENRISRLKNIMKDAVTEFGETGKTNKFIELPTVRLSTKNSITTEVNGERIGILLETFQDIAIEKYKNGIFYFQMPKDVETLLKEINDRIYTKYMESVEPFTIDDLSALEIDLITHCKLYDLCDSHINAFTDFLQNYFKGNSSVIASNTPKEIWKNAITNSAEENNVTCAKLVNNTSLLIK